MARHLPPLRLHHRTAVAALNIVAATVEAERTGDPLTDFVAELEAFRTAITRFQERSSFALLMLPLVPRPRDSSRTWAAEPSGRGGGEVTRYVALLRGIAPVDPRMRNVRLRDVCEALGLRNVSTVVSSGNLIFDADATDPVAIEAELEAAWPQRLGFHSTSIVRTYEELVVLRAMAPFGVREHGKETYLLVTFLKDRIDPSFTTPAAPLGPGFELVAATDRELFSVWAATTSRAPAGMAWMEREFGKAITSRTWLTVARILDRCERTAANRAER